MIASWIPRKSATAQSICKMSGFFYSTEWLVSNSTSVDTAPTRETWIQIWTTWLFLDANTASLPDVVSCQHGLWPMIGNLRCWNTIHLGNKDLCYCPIDYCWPHAVVPSKMKSNLIWRCQLTPDDWGIPNTKCASAALLCYQNSQIFKCM